MIALRRIGHCYATVGGSVTEHNGFKQMPDVAVMLRVQWGSEDAFAELYARYHRRLLDFFYGMSRSVQESEDLCHETFMRVWRLRGRYSPSGSFGAYLFTVARHIWHENARQVRKRWRLGVETPLESLSECLPNGKPGPDVLADRQEMNEKNFGVLDQLPDEQRMAFVLRTIDGLGLEEIARIMQCPVNTVRSRRLLAIRQLREALRGLFVI